MKPDIIYCSITGFGQTGPYAQRPGYDVLIQAMGGLMSITGEPDTKPGGGPMKVGVAMVDILTGLYATIGILAALTHRDRTGQGQHIDMSLLDVQVASLANQALNYLVSAKIPQRLGNRHPNIVPYQSFPTLDGHIILAIGNDDQFARFCTFLDRADLAEDFRFKTNEARVHNRDSLIEILERITTERSTAWWVSSLVEHNIPGGPINTIDQTFDDSHVQHREMKLILEGSDGAIVPSIANPIKLSKTPPEYRSAPPQLGEHTKNVLKELLGLSAEELEYLKKKNII
jgi:crotonobetainyl-CoA:carnitine CoA-transferase CaiB-like acyl-CoA transferase